MLVQVRPGAPSFVKRQRSEDAKSLHLKKLVLLIGVVPIFATPAWSVGPGGGDRLPNGPRVQYGRPGNASNNYYLDLCEDGSKEVSKRLRYCESAIRSGHDADNSRIYEIMGALFVGTSEVDKAVAAYEQSVAQNAGNADALVGKCRAEAESSKYSDAATADCARAAQHGRNIEDILERDGMDHFRANDLDAAKDDFDAVLHVDSKRPDSLFMRGVIEHKMGKTADGDADIQSALSIDPSVRWTYSKLGIAP